MKSYLRLFLLFTFPILFFIKCANVGQPTGGPKDLDPPKLVSIYPEDQSLNFNEKRIIFTFDEYIKLEEAKKQIIITPPIEESDYEFKVKNNILTLNLDKNLQSNTTYTLNLGESVRDITENNKAQNVKLGFSTGDYIDSLSLSGKVENLMKGTPATDVLVGIYDATDTFDIFNRRPLYFTKTDTAGFYQIENIKNGQYNIYAMADKNGNLKVEPTTEAFGFKGDAIRLDSSFQGINLKLHKMDIKEPKILSSRPDGNYYLVKFNKGVKEYAINVVDGNQPLNHNLIEENKTLRFYNQNIKDSLLVEIRVTDSLNQVFQDQVYLKFTDSRKKPEALKSGLMPPENEKIKEEFVGTITFNKPIKQVNSDSIFFQYDSLTISHIDAEAEISWNSNKTVATIKKKLDASLMKAEMNGGEAKANEGIKPAQSPANSNEEKEPNALRRPGNRPASSPNNRIPPGSVKLYISPGTFIGLENDSSSQIQRTYKFLNSEEVGTIEGTIETNFESYFIQLLDKNYKVIKELRNRKNFKFQDVLPGDYNVRILIDNNNNGEWFPGNINTKVEPEDVILHPEVLTIRANWERKDVNISF